MKWIAAVSLAVALLAVQPARGDEVTEKSKTSAEKGIRWILSAQNKDGSWGLDMKTQTCLSCTSLCGLALMSAGNHGTGGSDRECVEAVRSAVEFVMNLTSRKRRAVADEGANLIQYKLGRNAHVFFITVFLSQAYGMRDPSLSPEYLSEMRDVISDLAAMIAGAQEPDGSWHKEQFGALKATAMAWLALRSASSAGIEIKAAAVDKTVEFMKKAYDPSTGHFDRLVGGGGGYQTIYATSSALRVLYGMGRGETAEAKRGAEAFMDLVMKGSMASQFLTCEGEDFLSAEMMTECMMHENGKLWEKWFPWIREQLIKRQNNDGSWTSSGCISGRTFPTACSVLTLTAPYRLLPLHDH